MCIAASLHATVNPADPPVLRVPVSARATALGNALYCDGEEGLRYNPAYLADVDSDILQGTYGIFFENTRFAHASFVMPSDTFGIAGGYTGIFTQFDNFVDADTQARGTVDLSQTLVSLAAGMRVNDSPLLLGTGVRALGDRIAGAPSTSWMIDAGVGYLFSSRFKAGLVAHNALSLTGGSRDDAVGVTAVFSAAWRLPWIFGGQTAEDTNTLFAAARRENGEELNGSVGWESVFYRILSLRIGWDRTAPSAGCGFQYRSVAFDIATSWREEAFLNFVTLSFRFPRSAAITDTASAEATSPEPKPSRHDLAAEGWRHYEDNDTAGAEELFSQALKDEPGNESAAQGMQAIRVIQEKMRRKNVSTSLLAQGNAAFARKDYAKAVEFFTSVSNNEQAEEGLRRSVEASARVMAAALEVSLGSPPVKSSVTRSEAAAMARSGSFGSFDAAGQYLSSKSTGKALVAWQKVILNNNPVAQRFNPAFSTLISHECAVATDRAARLASKGQYAAAIAELDAVSALPGLSRGEKDRVQGMAASYRYVGSTMGKNSYDQAMRSMRQGQNAQAIVLFERAVQYGYQPDEARRHITGLKAMPASTSREDLSPGETGENLARAREFFRQNKRAECRTYLIRVLYVDPHNAEARKMMDEIENN